MEPIITLQRLTKYYEERAEPRFTVLEHISLTVNRGEFFVLVGPSGAGKSTILKMMSGLETSSSGQVQLARDVSPSDFGFVFQQFALLPWLSVAANIGLGLLGRPLAETEKKERVKKELARFGLEKFAGARPHTLSGGMKQRVGIARALVIQPKIIFMDEPFSELDSFTARRLRQELLQIWQEHKLTIVMVTHLVEEAIELADRIAIVTARPARIEKIIANPLARPRERHHPEFVNLENTLYDSIRP